MEIQNWYLIVDNEHQEVLDWKEKKADANYLLRHRYYDCRIVCACCAEDDDYSSPWACGKTFAEARKNLKAGIFDNWMDY